MDKKIDQIIDILLDDCLNDGKDVEARPYFFTELGSKDLLNLTQIFLEFKYPKQTRTSIKDQDKNAPTIDY